MKTVVFLGNYAPRCCGIATFTQDLRTAVLEAGIFENAPVAMVSDDPDKYEYPREVEMILNEQDRAGYLAAAEKLNRMNVDAISLQHEFGIYGGPSGMWLLDLLKAVKAPVVTTCHTVLRDPSPEQRHVMEGIARYSARLMVMAEKGRQILRDVYGVPDEKIRVIPHGIPNGTVTPQERAHMRQELGWTERRVLFTFGLVGPGKGIEQAIRALPEIVKEHPDTLYAVAGATHPNLRREQGESYREGLQALAEELGVAEHLQFINRFVSISELIQLIGAADVYLTPYLNEAQITSGTLAYAFGMGKPVISTPYWHATELLADNHGFLIPFGDHAELAKAANTLFHDDTLLADMSHRAFQKGRSMTWEAIGRVFSETLEEAMEAGSPVPARVRAGESIPQPVLHHFVRMMGDHGMFQHAKGNTPDPVHGFCTDDNARGVIALTDLMQDGHQDSRIDGLFTSCFDFVTGAYDEENNLFRNFMDAEGNWLEDYGSEDSQGRAIWSLGHVVHYHPQAEVKEAARHILRNAVPATMGFISPRAWAFTLLGVTNYLEGARGDKAMEKCRDELAFRLANLYERCASRDWPWFEDVVTYDNAKLCEALLCAARQTGNTTWARIGLRSLGFLVRAQIAEEGHFRPIGCNGFWKRGETPAQWDQQPLEAQAMVGACLEAWALTGQMKWTDAATRAFAWFHGGNDLSLPVADTVTGGCCDGLHPSGVNINQGAESTLAAIQSAAQLRLMRKVAAFTPFQEAPSRAGVVTAAA